jgi:hypothetical protein
MEGETRVLKDRGEIAALERRIRNAHERIRRAKNEKLEGRRDPGLHRKRVGLEHRRQIVAEDGDQGAEKRKDRDPQHHRAFVVAPDAGEPVDERHLRVGILVDVEHRKIRSDVAYRERGERHRHEGELRDRRRRGDAHEDGIVTARTDDRHGALNQCEAKRQHQSEMTEFGNHLLPPTGIAARCA